MIDTTPIQRVGDYFVKRDDLFEVAGVNGGKVRSCLHLMTHGGLPAGVVTAGARSSPQANIVAQLARVHGIKCRIHMPSGELSEQALLAQEAGAEIIQHIPGYNSVIVKRAKDDATSLGWREIPFGMECEEAVLQTKTQITEEIFGLGIKRIVVPVGSGMSLCGILQGLYQFQNTHAEQIPKVIGVMVGANPMKRIHRYAPMGWTNVVRLVPSSREYHDHVHGAYIGDIHLDEVYEAKCLEFLLPNDLLWIVGSRNKRGDV